LASPTNFDSARTDPCASVRLRYTVQASGTMISIPTKIIAGAAKSHFRCRFAQAEYDCHAVGLVVTMTVMGYLALVA